MDDYKLN